MPMQAIPLLCHSGGPDMGGGRGGVKGVSLLSRDLVGWESSKKEHWLSDPILLPVPSSPPSPLRRGPLDRGKIWLSPSPKLVARHQPGKSTAGMAVSP